MVRVQKEIARMWRSAEFKWPGILLEADKWTFYVKIYKNYRFEKQFGEVEVFIFHSYFVDFGHNRNDKTLW